MDVEVNLKCLLNWYQILRVVITTWLFVKPEGLVRQGEVSRALGEDETQDCTSNLHHGRSHELSQNEILWM